MKKSLCDEVLASQEDEDHNICPSESYEKEVGDYPGNNFYKPEDRSSDHDCENENNSKSNNERTLALDNNDDSLVQVLENVKSSISLQMENKSTDDSNTT